MVQAKLLVTPAKLLYHPVHQIQGHNSATFLLIQHETHAKERTSKRLLAKHLMQPAYLPKYFVVHKPKTLRAQCEQKLCNYEKQQHCLH